MRQQKLEAGLKAILLRIIEHHSPPGANLPEPARSVRRRQTIDDIERLAEEALK
jgi:hypothetical protein